MNKYVLPYHKDYINIVGGIIGFIMTERMKDLLFIAYIFLIVDLCILFDMVAL